MTVLLSSRRPLQVTQFAACIVEEYFNGNSDWKERTHADHNPKTRFIRLKWHRIKLSVLCAGYS